MENPSGPGPSTATLPPYQQPLSTFSSGPNPPGFPPPPGSISIAHQGPLGYSIQPQSSLAARPGQPPRPVRLQSPQQLPQDVRSARSRVESSLGEYMALQSKRYRTDEGGIEERIRRQAGLALGDLRALRQEVSGLVKAAESHRWRKWLIGGVMAAFIPAVRAIWRRPPLETETSNDTEYAFRKSKSLMRRILDSVHGGVRGLATVAFFVFAVMYIFQNEVSIRVAKTVSKRLKRLSAKLERGGEEVTEDDMKLLKGWRWRVLLWAE